MAKEDVVVPSAGESVTEATVGSIIAKEGTYVEVDASLIELETDKASMEVPAPVAGVVSYVVKEGDTLEIGAKICTIDTDGKGSAPAVETKEDAQAPAAVKETTPKEAPPKEAPSSDGGGVRKDMYEYLKEPTAKPQVISSAPAAKQEAGAEPSQVRKPMSRMRKVIAKRLVQVKNETAMLTTFNEVDMKAIMDMRSREKEPFLKKHGAKLTFLPFFIKAVVVALKEFPDVNAYIDGDEIVYNTGAHVGIAVSTDSGLVVPVIRDTDKLTFVEITQEITNLAVKARDRKLSIADMSGGTFTITNGGVFGSMLSTPILNPPQSAILGMHNIVERPVAINGKVEIRPIMYLALSYDHRIVDGKESVSFLVYMKKLLEDPAQFLLEG